MRKFLNALTRFFNNTVLITPNKLEKIILGVQKKKKKIFGFFNNKLLIDKKNYYRM
jgi:hypothetical protein